MFFFAEFINHLFWGLPVEGSSKVFSDTAFRSCLCSSRDVKQSFIHPILLCILFYQGGMTLNKLMSPVAGRVSVRVELFHAWVQHLARLCDRRGKQLAAQTCNVDFRMWCHTSLTERKFVSCTQWMRMWEFVTVCIRDSWPCSALIEAWTLSQGGLAERSLLISLSDNVSECAFRTEWECLWHSNLHSSPGFESRTKICVAHLFHQVQIH